jgi:single-stranded-DNA-specific exonuclease
VALVDRLAPFGMGNPEPVFLLRDCTVSAKRELQGGHLRLTLRKDGFTFAAIGFGMASRWRHPRAIDLAFSPQINEWRGERSVQLKIKDLRQAGSGDA